MTEADQAAAERAEVDAILRSDIFRRAPNLESFFRYVCNHYFAGEADKVKEYNIAVEALGRPADFDQKKDSIVRVEAHRLRKRLSHYYAGEGASHELRIVLPPGKYVPQFLARRARFHIQEPTEEVALEASFAPEPLPAPSFPERNRRPTRIGLFALIAIALASGVYLLWTQNYQKEAAPEISRRAGEVPEGEVRLLAGSHGKPFVDPQQRVWMADRYFNGGVSRTAAFSGAYEGLPDPAFAHSYREGSFRYDIPLVAGTYELRLYFIETQFGDGNPRGGAVNGRLFRIGLNGAPLLDLFDALSEAGAPNRLHTRVFRDVSPAPDGKLHLAFQPVTAPAFLSALELLPTSRGHVRPIRLVAQPKNVVDTKGMLWQADEYAVGGTQVQRSNFGDAAEHMLFQGERYGNFRYRIPVAPGKYRVRLYFAETFFGTKLSSMQDNPAGARIFNVFANGISLLRNFDVAREAGRSNVPVVKEFENMEPNAQGLLVLEFVPVHNYAEVNAIEVVEME